MRLLILIFLSTIASLSYAQNDNNIYTKSRIDNEASPKENMVTLLNCIRSYSIEKYPKDFKRFDGYVTIIFTVEKNGDITNKRFFKKADKKIMKHAMKSFNHCTSNWNPALIKGKPVRSQSEILINYTSFNKSLK